jgi:hypothetical protein
MTAEITLFGAKKSQISAERERERNRIFKERFCWNQNELQ